MTKTGSAICLAALVAALAASTSMAAAPTFLGEFCGWYTENIPPSPPCLPDSPCVILTPVSLPLKVGVTHLGGVYYLLQGRVDKPSNPVFLQATGVIVGDEVSLNGTRTQDHIPTAGQTVRDGGIWQARLNLLTMSGTFWSIQTDITTTDAINVLFGQRYITGQMQISSCF